MNNNNKKNKFQYICPNALKIKHECCGSINCPHAIPHDIIKDNKKDSPCIDDFSSCPNCILWNSLDSKKIKIQQLMNQMGYEI